MSMIRTSVLVELPPSEQELSCLISHSMGGCRTGNICSNTGLHHTHGLTAAVTVTFHTPAQEEARAGSQSSLCLALRMYQLQSVLVAESQMLADRQHLHDAFTCQ